jgi:transcriptional regulator of acetoin/glycerol metabolism
MADRTLTHLEGTAPNRSSRPALVLVLECARPLAGSLRFDLKGVDAVAIGRDERRSQARLEAAGERRLKIGVADHWMSSSHARLLKVMGQWLLEDSGSKNGTRVNGAPAAGQPLADGDLIEAGHTFFLFRQVEAPPDASLDAEAVPGGVQGTLCWPLEEQLERLRALARSEVPVLILGESGTGKELAARAVHRLSGRTGAFVPVNCGALAPTLLEAELFGSRKGAFTGAQEDREGLVKSAQRGTLFLDELGDLPAAAQPAFLRVLQEREVTPVGATRPVPVEFRLVAATHRDLSKLEAAGTFRQDLLARVSGFTLRLPPLRERIEDLGLLVGELLSRSQGSKGASFTCEAARALFAHSWPMNIRELEKCLLAAQALAKGAAIGLEYLPESVRTGASDAAGGEDDPARPLSEVEAQRRDELVALLREHHGNVSAVARAMGKARMQIQRWLKRFGLDPASFKV